jgi:hypothetical protein
MCLRRRVLFATAVLVLALISPANANQPPRLVLRTNPAADNSQDPPLIEGPAGRDGFVVRFNLCNSDDDDMIHLPDGTLDPNGDSLNWQFHFGDSGAPAFDQQGVFHPDADHECRVDHAYQPGDYIATLSVTDKHLGDQQHGVSAMARSTTTVRIRANAAQREEPAANPVCGTGAPCRVFVTSTMHRGNFGGLAAGDAICQARAAGATPPLPGNYKAWLSDGAGNSPNTRFTRNPGPYVLVDNTLIANDYTDLVTLGIITPINKNESGVPIPIPIIDNVWTGTRANGDRTPFADGNNGFTPNGQCTSNWDTMATGTRGWVGHTAVSGLGWTASIVPRPCSFQMRLYCFQQN